MKDKILVEGKFGHGARVKSKFHHKFKRLKRPNLGMSGTPFDWSKGVTGKPVYPVKNQYQSSSCWGQMYSRMYQIFKGTEELSAKSVYSMVFAPGGGTASSSGKNGALNLGLTTENNVPSSTMGNAPESFLEDTSWKTSPLAQDCLTRANMQVVNVPINIDSMAQAIRDYGCIGMIIEGTNNGTWLSSQPQPPKDNQDLWAHFMCSDSNISPMKVVKKLRFYNSWGVDVGESGFQYFTEDYINSGHIKDVFTFVAFKFLRDMSVGSWGSDVAQLQRKLGIIPLGIFGPITFMAVKVYQRENGLPITGYCGPMTRGKLNSGA